MLHRVESLRLRLYARHLAATKRPILVGPFYSELGFEMLYWLPFLNQLRATYGWEKGRLIALSRGGTAALYDMAGTAELYDYLPVDAVRLHVTAATHAAKTSKQYQIQPWESHVTALAASSLGLTRYASFHPSWMYRTLHPFWTDQMSMKRLAPFINPLAPPTLPLPPGLVLPEKFVAVRLYGRATMEAHDGVMLYLRQQLLRLAKKTPLVFLSGDTRYDDHADLIRPFADNMVDVAKYLTPQNNLAVQIAVLQRATLFVGTYGGLAQTALRCGIPAIALYTTWGGTAFAHVDLTHRLSLASGVPFHLVAPQSLEVMEGLW
jgi:hypothetical protein